MQPVLTRERVVQCFPANLPQNGTTVSLDTNIVYKVFWVFLGQNCPSYGSKYQKGRKGLVGKTPMYRGVKIKSHVGTSYANTSVGGPLDPEFLNKGVFMAETKMCNPAAIGLGGFAMTTFILQCHNLGWVGLAPVLWIGLVYGGTAQLVAGFLELKSGNNFGFSAFTSYGAFWIALCLFVIFGSSEGLVEAYPVLEFNANGLGFFLAMWSFYTFIMFIGAMRLHTALALLFLTLLLGFIGLTIFEFSGIGAFRTLAAWDLIVTALIAWYTMAHVIFEDTNLHLPVGKPWISS